MGEGCGGSGAVATPPAEPLLCEYTAHYFPAPTTNNIAEYDGLIHGLQLAADMGFTHLTIFGDSQLVLRQMQGIYRLRHPGLRELYRSAREWAAHFHCTWVHRLRDGNQAADFLSKRAPDLARDFSSPPTKHNTPLPLPNTTRHSPHAISPPYTIFSTATSPSTPVDPHT
ncbi:hypothetical protein DYB38_011733 [Aphanomyces astaci]|uniref:RNase H type-1 domain-containing protein n=1 Tax=Aphanomyces astaci TaxID=112090 RepID=A0A397C223_APHAT|nr:hypothetical protein DYB38_011733 [Aphanomyces astaci]